MSQLTFQPADTGLLIGQRRSSMKLCVTIKPAWTFEDNHPSSSVYFSATKAAFGSSIHMLSQSFMKHGTTAVSPNDKLYITHIYIS